MSTTEVLFHANTLHSLRHEQLVELCKIHGVKHTGKKSELVERLQKHGSTLPRNRGGLPRPGDDLANPANEDGTQWVHQPRYSEPWEVLESIEEVEERSSQGTLNSTRGATSGAGEFGTATSKTSTVSSSIRALANSLGIKKSASTKHVSTKPSSSPSKEHNQLEEYSVPYASIPVNSDLPETDHFVLSELDEPLPGQATRIGSQAVAGARLSLSAVPGHAPSTPSKKGAATTIRLVSNSTVVAGSGPQTPQLKPFATTFDLTMGTPSKPHTPKDRSKIYPTLPSPPPPPPKVVIEDDMDVDMPGGFGSGQPEQAQSDKPFVFGSPRASAAFTFNTSGAAKLSVLEEMNQRLAQQGVESVPQSILTMPKASTDNTTTTNQKRASVSARFDSAHRVEEERMESIASWARRREGMGDKNPGSAAKKRKSSVLGDAPGQPQKARVSIQRADKDEEENRRLSKRPRVSTLESTATPEAQQEKEREAVKRMLERNRQKRRSSMGVPRTSVGKAPPPKPKPRFGFLSSAKSLVRSVWGRSQTSTKTVPPATVSQKGHHPAQKQEPTSNPVDTPKNVQSPRGPAASSKNSRARLPLPSFDTDIPAEIHESSQNSGDSRTKPQASSLGARISSGGQRSGTLVPKAQRVSCDNSADIKPQGRVSSGSSRLLAPTASSLAKRQNIGSSSQHKQLKAQPRSSQGTHPTSRIPVASPSAGRIFRQPLQSPPPGSSVPATVPRVPQATPKVETSVPAGEVPSIGRTGRKPRISRSKVIAKLASKREAVVPVQPSGKTRSSLGAAVAGAKAAGTGVRKSDAAISAAKKRARQSEINRRRNKGITEE